jgi:hypothetical protein
MCMFLASLEVRSCRVREVQYCVKGRCERCKITVAGIEMFTVH